MIWANAFWSSWKSRLENAGAIRAKNEETVRKMSDVHWRTDVVMWNDDDKSWLSWVCGSNYTGKRLTAARMVDICLDYDWKLGIHLVMKLSINQSGIMRESVRHESMRRATEAATSVVSWYCFCFCRCLDSSPGRTPLQFFHQSQFFIEFYHIALFPTDAEVSKNRWTKGRKREKMTENTVIRVVDVLKKNVNVFFPRVCLL